MRCGCLFFLIAIAMIGFGIDGIHQASSYRAPVSITYDAFSRSTPKAGWYRVTGCRLELPESVYAVENRDSLTDKELDKAIQNDEDKITKVYLPVHNDRGPDPAQVRLLIQTEDPTIISTIQEMRRLKNAPEQKVDEWIRQNESRMILHRDLQGMVSESTSLDSDVRDKVRKVPGLAPSYAVLEDGDKPPTMFLAMASLVGGGVLFVVMCLFFLSSFIKPGSGKE